MKPKLKWKGVSSLRTVTKTLWHIACISALVFSASSVLSEAVLAAVPATAFRPVLHDLVGHTSIPILLPAWLPAGASGQWAEAQTGPNSYAVFLPDKAEHLENAPHSRHSVQAQRITGGKRLFPGTPVRLANGRIGGYQSEEENAGARPGDACVSWVQGGVEYAVFEYDGTRDDVVRMANSVVLVQADGQNKQQRKGRQTTDVPTTAVPTTAVPNIAFRGVLAKVIHDSDVPVLLPAYLPAWPGGYYISLGDDERGGWPIRFQSRLDLGPEDDSADVGFFDARKITTHLAQEPVGVRVTLTGGRSGHYRQITSPQYRDAAGEIWWQQNGVRYRMQWRTLSRAALIQIANSVVRARTGTDWPSAAAITQYADTHQDPVSGFHYDAHYSVGISKDSLQGKGNHAK